MTTELLGIGIYSVPEAARLTRIPSRSIRRWLKGYSYSKGGEEHSMPPVWQRELPILEDQLALGFLDLLEVRFVHAFREHGVGWKTIRLAAERAAEILGQTHPFCTQIFKTDGKTIFAELAPEVGDPHLLDLVHNQYAFRDFLAPYLYKGIEFSDDAVPARWRPMPRNRRVVLDPERQFGQPIVEQEGVPTQVLAAAYRVEQSLDRVARWYEVDRKSVQAAVDFEDFLEKAA